MKFSEQLQAQAKPIMDAINKHPFVEGLAKGDLPKEALISYVQQDYLFLKKLREVWASAIRMSKNDEQVRFFWGIIEVILDAECDAYDTFCEQAGVKMKDMKNAIPSPKAYLYEAHLDQAVLSGNMFYLLAAFAPTQWTYLEFTRHILDSDADMTNNPFKPVLDFYLNEENYAGPTFKFIDEMAETATKEELAEASQFFLKTCELEWQFWEQAYYQQDWHFKEVLEASRLEMTK